jgi:hypothetical protein
VKGLVEKERNELLNNEMDEEAIDTINYKAVCM